jgi:hypothetical protein
MELDCQKVPRRGGFPNYAVVIYFWSAFGMGSALEQKSTQIFGGAYVRAN